MASWTSHPVRPALIAARNPAPVLNVPLQASQVGTHADADVRAVVLGHIAEAARSPADRPTFRF